jgi:protein TonB
MCSEAVVDRSAMRLTDVSIPPAAAASDAVSLVAEPSYRDPAILEGPEHLVPLTTLVLWLGCMAVGVAGWVLHYPPPEPLANAPAPAAVQAVNVNISLSPAPASAVPPADAAPAPPAESPPPPAQTAPPPPTPEPPAALSAPPLENLAVPIAAPAFAVPAKPVPQPAQAVLPARPAAVAPAAPPRPAGPQRITFGQGEGLQPAPLYPREAVIDRIQGTVVIRFTVRQDGSVQHAEISQPCSSALLNQAALRAVRETWHFPRGAVREYEVAIQFELQSR